jgi:predicted RNase H-like nuclease
MDFAGIDGCHAGWFAVIIKADTAWEYRLLADAKSVADLAARVAFTLIDVPIGLVDSGPEERLCDKEARRLLQPYRGSSVFPAPARAALKGNNFAEATEINKRYTGRGLSRQSWAIVRKIREIDELLQADPSLRGRIRECHPEVCFWALNNRAAMRHSKKKPDGRRERLEVIQRFFPDAERVLKNAAAEFRRKDVALDDIVDAMVAAVSARKGKRFYRTTPLNPAQDSTGLPMEIVYVDLFE